MGNGLKYLLGAYIPQQLCSLLYLSQPLICNGKLTSLPKEFTQLTGITNIKVESNELTELPEDLGNLTKLENLNCICSTFGHF